MGKPILCLDFDGVIHSYTSGWKGAAVIPDPPVPGALDFIRRAVEHFEVHIFSSRSNQDGGINAMRDYLWDHAVQQYGVSDARFIVSLVFAFEKPHALVTIDDRAITFNGTWPAIDDLRAFKPWNKK